MANDTTKSPWIIDTASGTPIATSDMKISIRMIRWLATGVLAINANVVVQDGGARDVWRSGNPAAVAGGTSLLEESVIGNGGVVSGENFLTDGLTVPTLPANTKLYIYLV